MLKSWVGDYGWASSSESAVATTDERNEIFVDVLEKITAIFATNVRREKSFRTNLLLYVGKYLSL
jgi:hypothetical protein